ncbi:MAG: hypothetical protein ABI743_12730, partial [bacterium]
PSTRNTSYCVVVRWSDAQEGLEEIVPICDLPNEDLAACLASCDSRGIVLREASPNLPLAPDALFPTGWTIEAVAAEHSSRLLDLWMEAGEEWEADDPLTVLPAYVRPPQATLVHRPRLFGTPP